MSKNTLNAADAAVIYLILCMLGLYPLTVHSVLQAVPSPDIQCAVHFFFASTD